MAVINASKDRQLSNTLSFRVSDLQLRHIQEILRNYEIRKGSMSDQLRELLRQELFRSRRFRRNQAELRKKLKDRSYTM
jgi:hypothetical protein